MTNIFILIKKPRIRACLEGNPPLRTWIPRIFLSRIGAGKGTWMGSEGWDDIAIPSSESAL